MRTAKIIASTRSLMRWGPISPCSSCKHRLHERNAACSADPEKPDVRKLADLAHLDVSDEEVRDWEPKLESIAEWFKQLQNVDLKNVDPALRATSVSESRLRADEAYDSQVAEAILALAPDREASYIKVPKINTEAD